VAAFAASCVERITKLGFVPATEEIEVVEQDSDGQAP
jgi:hypothetical protein